MDNTSGAQRGPATYSADQQGYSPLKSLNGSPGLNKGQNFAKQNTLSTLMMQQNTFAA